MTDQSPSAEPEGRTRLEILVPDCDAAAPLGDAPHDSTGHHFVVGAGRKGASYHGFGLRTPRHVLVHGFGDISKVVVQSRSDVLLQSLDGNLRSTARTGHYTASGGEAVVAASDNVTITAGFGHDPTIRSFDADREELTCPDPEALRNDGSTMLLATGAAALHGAGVLARTVYGLTKRWGTPRSTISDGVKGAITVAGVGLTTAMASATPGPNGVNLVGRDGVFVGTLGFASMFALGGFLTCSLYPLTMGLDPEVLGLHGATLSGVKRATVRSGKQTIIQSGDRVHLHGTTVAVRGRHMKTGLTSSYLMAIEGEHKFFANSWLTSVMSGANGLRTATDQTHLVGGEAHIHLAQDSATIRAPGSVTLEGGGDVSITGNRRVLLGAPPAPPPAPFAAVMQQPEMIDMDMEADEDSNL